MVVLMPIGLEVLPSTLARGCALALAWLTMCRAYLLPRALQEHPYNSRKALD